MRTIVRRFLGGLTCAAAVAAFSPQTDAALQLWYDFEEDNGAAAVQNRGVLGGVGLLNGDNLSNQFQSGAPNSFTPGGGLFFDDDNSNPALDYIHTTYQASTLGVSGNTADYTMAAWVNVSSFNTTNQNNGDNMVFGQDNGTDGSNDGEFLHNGFRADGNNGENAGKIHFGHWGADSNSGSVRLPQSEWHHVAWRYTGDAGGNGQQEIFVDGQQVSSATARGLLNDSGPVLIGTTNPFENRDFHGVLDDVVIYDSSLGLRQLQALAQGANPQQLPADPDPRTGFMPGFNATLIEVGDQGSNTEINNTSEARRLQQNVSGTGLATINGDTYDITEFATAMPQTINYGGGGGSFGGTQPYPGAMTADSGSDFQDFMMHANAFVTIPEGTWTIAFGSDDGGLLQLENVVFDSTFGENNGGGSVMLTMDDEIRYEDPRGHTWTGGSFMLDESFQTRLDALFFERGGGDSWEIAIAPGVQTGFNSEFRLLQDGELGWIVSKNPVIPEPTTAGLAMLAIGGLGLRIRRRRHA